MKRFFIKVILFLLVSPLIAQSQTKYTTSNLNLRENPWIGDNIICVIPQATSLTVDYSKQEYTDWIKIAYNRNVGYVYSKYLTSLQLKNVFSNPYEFSRSTSHVKYYINSQGIKVQSPTYYNTQPAGATAVCRDGTYSFSRNRRGTCSHHGGVARWL
jgi:uncharacterized protein YgiM (DUF1202 family)